MEPHRHNRRQVTTGEPMSAEDLRRSNLKPRWNSRCTANTRTSWAVQLRQQTERQRLLPGQQRRTAATQQSTAQVLNLIATGRRPVWETSTAPPGLVKQVRDHLQGTSTSKRWRSHELRLPRRTCVPYTDERLGITLACRRRARRLPSPCSATPGHDGFRLGNFRTLREGRWH